MLPEQEVGETFLRCVKERFAETNAVIELNGLKIAEDRTFADCARYIFTAMLQVHAEGWVGARLPCRLCMPVFWCVGSVVELQEASCRQTPTGRNSTAGPVHACRTCADPQGQHSP